MGVNLATFPGAPDGIRRDQEQHMIPDTACWMLLDAWCHKPGILERRSAVRSIYGSAYASASQAVGMAGTTAPDGTWVGIYFASRDSDNTGRLVGFYNSSMDQAWHHDFSTAPHPIFDSKGALKGGVLIGTASDATPVPTSSALSLWRGAKGGDVTGITAGAAINRGDTTITVSSGTNLRSGHFLFQTEGALFELIGVVKSVSGTTVTLENKALVAVPNGDDLEAYVERGISPRVSKGRITTSTTSTTVNGGLTQFRKLGMGTPTWDLFTTDYTYIGTVLSVTSDTQLELDGSGAAVDLLNADYIAVKRNGTYTSDNPQMGILNAQHAAHQFYAKGNTVYWSDDDDPEALDLVDDNLTFDDNTITAMISTQNALLVMSARTTHTLSGAVGTTPDRWVGDDLLDDGALNPMVCQSYKEGAIWAGQRGIYFWGGGGAPQVISAGLGDVYEKIIEARQANTSYWSAITRDHYLLYVEGTDQTELKGFFEGTVNTSTTPDTQPGDALERFCIAINLKTGSISLLLNMGLKGFVQAGDRHFTCVTAVTAGSASARATVIDLDELWVDADASTVPNDVHVDVLEEDSRVYPQFSLETKKYDFGNPQILKLIKLFLLHYRLAGTADSAAAIIAETADSLRFATVKGMGSTGEVAAKKLYPVADGDEEGEWQDKRVKFMKRSQFLAMRVWQGTNTITRLELGAWALGFKQKRPGRV